MGISCISYQALPLELEPFAKEWASRGLVPLETQKVSQEETLNLAPTSKNCLGLNETEKYVLLLNPSLRLARAEAQVAQISFEEAGRWEDPHFQFDMARLLASAAQPWILATAIGFTLPLSGRLEALKQTAQAEHQVALAKAYEAERETLQELRRLWTQLAGLEETLQERERFCETLKTFQSILNRLLQTQEISYASVRLVELELALQQGKHLELQQECFEKKLKIKALLGVYPDFDLEFSPRLEAPSFSWPSLEQEPSFLLKHPQVQRLQAEYQVAEKELYTEICKQYPDLQIGPAYEWEEGNSRLGFSLEQVIPLWNRNQGNIRVFSEKRKLLKDRIISQYQELYSRFYQEKQAFKNLLKRREYEDTVVFPLLEKQQEEIQKLLDLKEFNPSLILETQQKSLELRLQRIELRLQERLIFQAWEDLLPSVSLDKKG